MKTEYKFEFSIVDGKLRVLMSRASAPDKLMECFADNANDVLANPKAYWDKGTNVFTVVRS